MNFNSDNHFDAEWSYLSLRLRVNDRQTRVYIFQVYSSLLMRADFSCLNFTSANFSCAVHARHLKRGNTRADFTCANSTAQLVRDISGATSRTWDHVRTSHAQTLQSDHRCVDFSIADFPSPSPRFFAEGEKLRLREVWNGARWPPVDSAYFARLPAAAEAPATAAATGAAPLTTAALITAPILTSATLAAPAEHVASGSAPDEHLTSAARGATANHVVRDVAVPRPDVVVEPLSQLEDF